MSVPDIDTLELPESFKRVVNMLHGLVLVTGPNRQRQIHYHSGDDQAYITKTSGPPDHHRKSRRISV